MMGDWDRDGRIGMEDFAKTTLAVGMMDDCEFMEDEENSARRNPTPVPQGSNNTGCLVPALVLVGLFVALCLFFWVIEIIAG